MALFKDLSESQKRLVRKCFKATMDAITDDPSGHLPNCGYTEENRSCGCQAMGIKLHNNLVEVAAATPRNPIEKPHKLTFTNHESETKGRHAE